MHVAMQCALNTYTMHVAIRTWLAIASSQSQKMQNYHFCTSDQGVPLSQQ